MGFIVNGIIGYKGIGASPKTIVVSIAPLYSLTLNLIKNIRCLHAQLLIHPKQSGHCATLKPSQIILIKNAALIIMVGPMYETSLWPQLSQTQTPILSMAESPGLIKKMLRHQNPCNHHHPSHHTHSSHTMIDGHFWLMPANAKAFCAYVKNYLMKLLDHSNDHYQLEQNYKEVIERIEELEKTIHCILDQGILYQHYWLYHDFMNYFDAAFTHVPLKGILTTDVGSPIKPSIIVQMKKDVHCCVVYLEPQFHHQSLENFCAQHGVKTKILDYVGYDQNPDQDSYFTTMRTMAKRIVSKE
jgi:ABC-type Zn2+ transport system substrate-binding protein/surface adhesin